MTRDDFIQNITDLYQLLDFCKDNGLESCDGIYTDDEKDEYISDHLYDLIQGSDSWQLVRDTLSFITEGYAFYERDPFDWMGFVPITDEMACFRSCKSRVIIEMDANDLWDEPDEECGIWDEFEDESLFTDEPSDEFEADPNISLDDFFASNAKDFDKMTKPA